MKFERWGTDFNCDRTHHKKPRRSKLKKQGYLTKKLKEVPSDALRIKYKDCHDLAIEHLCLRHQATLLGMQLDAKLGRGSGNPARRAFNQGDLDCYGFSLIEKLTRNYLAIFQVIVAIWEFLPPLGLEDTDELFSEVLREHFERRFQNAISGYVLTTKQVEQQARAFRQKVHPILGNPKKVGEIIPESNQHPWFNLVLSTARKLAETDVIIHQAVTDLDREISSFVSWHADFASRSRQGGNTKLNSLKWEDKRLFVGVKGGYKPALQNLTK
jgi:hypothetical protein